MPAIGQRTWAIAEGWLPPRERPKERAFESHETACILNAGDSDAHVEIEIFFADRGPAGPYRVTVGARRTLHLRFDDLAEPEPIPRGTDYAAVLRSDVPVVVQHTRLDSRSAGHTIMTTLAFPVAGARAARRRAPPRGSRR